MSQVFSADSVNGALGLTIATTSETGAVTGNFLNPPFANCKAVVSGTISFTVGAGTTAVTIRIRRNPSAENLQVAGASSLQVTAGNNVTMSFQGADSVPDGRAVQYQLTVTQQGATGNGTVNQSCIAAVLISG